ncbi:ammonium transporter [Propioniciclava soli]|uniref:Ammonium transporter n=1 Tax=Propioniciclava soli TaxID=2775081 RepID=A0ABZ3C931_9ACTN|nr:ammonium transporter [Propioniciclava soli]
MDTQAIWEAASPIWVMVSAGLVLFMTPGLAFFYGGLSRARSAINMMMMSFAAMGLVALVWLLWGYSMSGGGTSIAGIFADPISHFGLTQIGGEDLVGVGFGATFAIITVALISGAVADRARFKAWMVFVPVWVTLVYCPLAFMVWGGGLLSADGAIGSVVGEALDFAGGLVVHMAAGLAALVLALMIGKRTGFSAGIHRPHSIPFVMLGAAILWFGWFGFNGGAAGTIAEAGLIWVNTLIAPGIGMVAWLLTEQLRDGRMTSVGAASGIVAGLVAITPACAFVTPLGAAAIGAVAGIICCFAVNLKFRVGIDDSLDVVGLHFVAGLWGTLSIGLLAVPLEDGRAGLFYGGGLAIMTAQVVAVLVTTVFTVSLTALIAWAIHKTIGFRITAEDEEGGIDLSEHRESAYDLETALAYTGEGREQE